MSYQKRPLLITYEADFWSHIRKTVFLTPLSNGIISGLRNKNKKRKSVAIFCEYRAMGPQNENFAQRKLQISVGGYFFFLAPPTEIRLVSVGRASSVNVHKKGDSQLKLERNCSKSVVPRSVIPVAAAWRCGYGCRDR